MRRVEVVGNLNLFGVDPPNTGAGYASGGFMANCKVSESINAGSQQQFFSRNNDMTTWENGAWNFVFLGCPNAPAENCGNTSALPVTKVNETPLIAEKPFISLENGRYYLNVPGHELNKVGTNWTGEVPLDKKFDFSNVYVANERDSADTI